MTRKDLGILRDEADKLLNARLRQAAEDIRAALDRCGILTDSPSSKHPLFTDQEREILGLLISDDPTQLPGWAWEAALENLVLTLTGKIRADAIPVRYPILSVAAPPESVKVEIDLGWVSAKGFVDTSLGFPRAFVVSYKDKEAEGSSAWSEEQ